jgi:hypothetical protein
VNFIRRLWGQDNDDDDDRKANEKLLQDASERGDAARKVALIVIAGDLPDWQTASKEIGFAKSRDVQNADHALADLQTTPPDRQELLQELMRYIDMPPNNERYYRAFVVVSEPAIEAVVHHLQSDDDATLINALAILSKLHASTAVAQMRPFLTHANRDVRQQAVEALGNSGHPEAHEALMQKNLRVDKTTLTTARYQSDVPARLDELQSQFDANQAIIDEAGDQRTNASIVAEAENERLAPIIERLQRQLDRFWSVVLMVSMLVMSTAL